MIFLSESQHLLGSRLHISKTLQKHKLKQAEIRLNLFCEVIRYSSQYFLLVCFINIAKEPDQPQKRGLHEAINNKSVQREDCAIALYYNVCSVFSAAAAALLLLQIINDHMCFRSKWTTWQMWPACVCVCVCGLTAAVLMFVLQINKNYLLCAFLLFQLHLHHLHTTCVQFYQLVLAASLSVRFFHLLVNDF